MQPAVAQCEQAGFQRGLACGRCDAAAAALRRLLELPDQRPGSWEAGPVTQLGDELRGILDELTDGAS